MIVGFQPGGTINSVRVVLRPHETLPNKYNNLESEVYREDAETYKWILIKPVGVVFPNDSEILSQPEVLMGTILNLTVSEKGGTNNYEHIDIIRLDSGNEDSGSDDNSNGGGS